MTTTAVNTVPSETQALLDKILALPPAQRTLVAERLWESLDEPEELSEAQIAELERRSKEIDDGTARMIPADEARQLIRERRKI